MELITWVEEHSARFLGNRGVLDYRKTCIAGRGAVIVHRDLDVRALKVGTLGVNPEVLTAPPRNLGDHQGRKGDETNRALTDVSPRVEGDGAATTSLASKPRVSKVARANGKAISAIRVFPSFGAAFIYPTGAEAQQGW